MAHAYKFGFSTAPPRYFLLAAAMVPLTANATTLPDCPHAIADYGTYTPTEFYSGRPTDQLGSPFTFLNETDTCFTTPVAEWCDENIAFVPSGTPVPKPLFLFFHGAGNRPSDHTHVAHTAAYAGYPTILLSWDGAADGVPLTRTHLCTDDDVDHDNNPATNTVSLIGGDCTDGCLYDLGIEMLTGADTSRTTTDSGMEYAPRPIRSVVQRTAMFLNDLYLFDENTNATNDYHWNQYCSYQGGETKIDWDNVVVGGFSMGANMASFISFTEGTHGLLALEGGADICKDVDPTSYDITGGLAEYYDSFAVSNIDCGDGSCDNQIMALHETGLVWPLIGHFDLMPHLDVLGFQLGGTDSDEQITLDDGFLDTATAIVFLNQTANIMTTNQVPASTSTAFHASMAVGTNMPNTVNDGMPTGDTADVYLFPAYLEAMCSLQ